MHIYIWDEAMLCYHVFSLHVLCTGDPQELPRSQENWQVAHMGTANF